MKTRLAIFGWLAGTCLLLRPAPAAPSFSDVRWIMHDGSLEQLLALAPEEARLYFSGPLANIQGNPHPKIPAGWRSTPHGHYTSYPDLVRDLAAGTIDAAKVPVLIYDNERWTRTPREEQLDPVRYMALFTKLAHEHGFVTNLAPDQNLASPLVGITKYQGGETRNWQSFLRLGLAASAARTGTERFHVMSQPFQSYWGRTPERTYVGGEAEFVAFVTQAALQARAINPKILITCGFSTNKRYRPTAELMYQETVDVRHIVDGYWLNIWGNPMGVAYLRLLSGPAPEPNSSVLFAQREGGLGNRQPAGDAAAKFSLATAGATLTSESAQTYPAGTVIPAGAWQFQFWTDGASGTATLGLEFGFRDATGARMPIVRADAGWTPNVPAGALGAADAAGAFTTTKPTTFPAGGPYRLYWTITVQKPAAFNLLYGAATASTNVATPFVQPITPALASSP